MAKDILHELQNVYSLKSRKSKIILIILCFFTGIFSGLIVSSYTLLLNKISFFRNGYLTNLTVTKIIVGLIIFISVGIVIQFMFSKYPLIGGSGIPQVNAFLNKKIKFNWLPELFTKFFGGVLAVGAGMALGREGPSVHLGALIGSGIKKITKRTETEEKYLVTCGASAGIASTFNAPLAGVIFSLEELHKFFSPLLLICVLVASGTSNYVSRMILGPESSFQYNFMLPKHTPIYIIGIVTLVFCLIITILGRGFSYFLLLFQKKFKDIKMNKYLKISLFMVVVYLVAIFFKEITGGGHDLIEKMFSAKVALKFLVMILIMKFFYTMFCYSSGFPGGIFLPMLVIGALSGKVYGEVLNHYFEIPNEIIVHFMILGMAAYFTAVVRAPITGITLILEMTGNFSYLYMLIIVCTIVYIFTELFKMEPIYERLYLNMFEKEISQAKKEKEKIKKEKRKKEKRLEILENWWKERYNKNKRNNEDKIVTLLIPVGVNSEFDGKLVKELKLPENILIVSVRAEGEDHIAKGNTKIQSGNQLVMITDHKTAVKYASELKERGLKVI